MCEGKNNTCDLPWTNSTLSDHHFCTGCRIEHDAHMARGFLKRAAAGDWYLIPEALAMCATIRAFADLLEEEIRDTDQESDGGLNPDLHGGDFIVGDQAIYRKTPSYTETVEILDRSHTPDNGTAYLTRSAYGLQRWVRWSKLAQVEA